MMTNEIISLHRTGLMQEPLALDGWRQMRFGSRQRPVLDGVTVEQQQTVIGWHLERQQEATSLIVSARQLVKEPTGFTLTDFMSLLALLVLPLSIVLYVVHRSGFAALVACIGFTLIVVVNSFGGVDLAE